MCGDKKAIQDEGECLVNVNINVIVVPLGVGQQRRGQSVVAEGPKSASGSLSANGLENIGSAQQVSDAASQREPKNGIYGLRMSGDVNRINCCCRRFEAFNHLSRLDGLHGLSRRARKPKLILRPTSLGLGLLSIMAFPTGMRHFFYTCRTTLTTT